MPELPEVETTMRGIAPYVCGQRIDKVIVRHRQLRWPVAPETAQLGGCRIESLARRGKYILMRLDRGSLIWHLGMSGSMRIQPLHTAPESHEHIEIQLASGQTLKYRDPRRFGALLYTADDPYQHRLIRLLGPEPFTEAFNADYLHQRCKGRTASIKSVIMDGQVVTGVGNIYACEALFQSGIRPTRKAGKLSKPRLARLIAAIQQILEAAILQGGTTLQDFSQADGKPGYFSQQLQVYGIKGDCKTCGTRIRQITQGQRSSYFCPACQS